MKFKFLLNETFLKRNYTKYIRNTKYKYCTNEIRSKVDISIYVYILYYFAIKLCFIKLASLRIKAWERSVS